MSIQASGALQLNLSCNRIGEKNNAELACFPLPFRCLLKPWSLADSKLPSKICLSYESSNQFLLIMTMIAYSPRFAWGAHTAGFFGQLKHIYKKSFKNIVFFRCFYNVFRRKHRYLHGFRPKVGPKHWFLQCFQCSGIKKRSIPWSSPQTLENTAIYTVFFNFSMCQCRWPTQTYIQKIIQKHCFFQCFYIFSVQKNTGFCSVFNALASKNHSKYRYLQCFFISVRFSLAGSRPKWPQIPFQWPLKLRHPKIVEKTRKHHPTEVSVRNRFCPPPPLPS